MQVQLVNAYIRNNPAISSSWSSLTSAFIQTIGVTYLCPISIFSLLPGIANQLLRAYFANVPWHCKLKEWSKLYSFWVQKPKMLWRHHTTIGSSKQCCTRIFHYLSWNRSCFLISFIYVRLFCSWVSTRCFTELSSPDKEISLLSGGWLPCGTKLVPVHHCNDFSESPRPSY